MDAEGTGDDVTAGTIWLVRHASTDWTGRRWCGRRDLELNDAGRAEAAALAARVSPLLDAPLFVSSPLLRARQTAEIVASRIAGDPAARVSTDPDLVEVDVGLVEGLGFDGIEAAHPDLAAALLAARVDVDWPGGERGDELRARVERAWRRLTRLEAPGDLVVVSHGGVIASLLRLLADDADAAPTAFAAPASAMRVVHDGGRWRATA